MRVITIFPCSILAGHIAGDAGGADVCLISPHQTQLMEREETDYIPRVIREICRAVFLLGFSFLSLSINVPSSRPRRERDIKV